MESLTVSGFWFLVSRFSFLVSRFSLARIVNELSEYPHGGFFSSLADLAHRSNARGTPCIARTGTQHIHRAGQQSWRQLE
jgi:hypothetical protein